MDENKPTPLDSSCLADGSFRQNASQMWTLGRFLPLIVGHLIPEDDEHWINNLRLLSIMDILFTPKVQKDDCSYLESLISDHHHTLQSLYPGIHITPKLHYMIHMPRLMLEYGPLIQHWTIRFEAKHCYFKQLSSVMGNFTNICHSLSLRHQLYQCYINLNTYNLPGEELEIGPGHPVVIPECRFWVDDSFEDIGGQSYSRVNWVKQDGIQYQKEACVILGKK